MAITVGGQDPALVPGSLVLVTGANSFIGSHVCDQLLEHGYRVHGTVRSKERCRWVAELFEKKHGPGRFELFELKGVEDVDTFRKLVEGPQGVVNVANLNVYETFANPDPKETIPAIVNGAIDALKAALESGTVKRFVYTSSSAAVYLSNPKAKVPKTISPNDYNVEAVIKAWGPPPYDVEGGTLAYTAAKVQAEVAMLKMMREQEGDMTLNIVNPEANWGPLLNTDAPSSTGGMMLEAWKTRDVSPLKFFADSGIRSYVNVQDTARLHISALLDPDVKSERILGHAGHFSARLVREEFLKIQKEIGEAPSISGLSPDDWEGIDEIDNRRSEELLRRLGRDGWEGLTESIKANIGM